MDRIAPWGNQPFDSCPGVALYQMREGSEEKHSEMVVSMLMVAARAGRAIASAVLRMYVPAQI